MEHCGSCGQPYRQPFTLQQLQAELALWHIRNFPDQTADQCLIGAVEELGELAHAHLKERQSIRRDEDHVAGAKDAVGDVIVFLAGYCNKRGFNLQEVLEAVWCKVKQRDYTKEQS